MSEEGSTVTENAMKELLADLASAGVLCDVCVDGDGHYCEFYIPDQRGVEVDRAKRRAVRTKDMRLAALVLRNHYVRRGNIDPSVEMITEALRLMRAADWCRNFADCRTPLWSGPGVREVVVKPLPWGD